MNKRESHLFNVAREVSRMSDFHAQHLGAVVVEGKTIISTGFNTQKTNPTQHRYNFYRNFNHPEKSIPKCHAEVSALNHLIGKKDIDWNNVSIYVYREWKDGSPACSRPCVACSKLIKDLGIKNIYFIDEEGNYCKERTL